MVKTPVMVQKSIVEDTLIERQGEPVWEIANLFPPQGAWSEADYLELETNHLVEFSHGYLEVLPMPTPAHQFILLHLYRLLWTFVEARQLGHLLIAPVRLQLWPGKYREPDIVFVAGAHSEWIKEKYLDGANLVIEVISGGKEDRHRDRVTKRDEYAQAGIAEYWIVDPKEEQITILQLSDDRYTVHGEFKAGQQATSRFLPGFSIEVTAVFAAAVGESNQ